MMIELTDDQKRRLLTLARSVIGRDLGVENVPGEPDLDDPVFSEKYGVFVTLHIDGQLRGCIGNIQGDRPLRDGVRTMARSAAFHDPRFPALTAREYPLIDIEISVMSPIEKVESIDDIKVGRDGLIISRGYHSGLLLPQVATEQRWDTYTFLQNTCFKAGLQHDAWQKEDTVIEKFSALVFGEKEMEDTHS
jgi:AmmeMemoRadiSam system protein A